MSAQIDTMIKAAYNYYHHIILYGVITMATSASLATVPVAAVAPGVALSIVENRPGYNSWPMIQAVGDTLVCAYGRGKGHFVESSRGAYVHTSSDGGRTWSPEVGITNDPEICEGVEGAGLDSSGAALFWMNCRGRGHIRHELYRTEDGVTFTKIAPPEMSPEPIQVMDIFTVPGVGLMSLWFTGDYKSREPCNSWGTLVSRDDGKTWTQRTVESGLAKREWPTEPSAVVLPDGRILAIARTELSRACQLQLVSADGGETWTKRRTNITDVCQSTPSLILDAARGLVHCYYFERGPGLLKRRTARVADILADPSSWQEPEVLALGGKVRPYDSGNAKATAIGDRHFVAYYAGDPTNAAIVVAATKAPEQSP